MLRLIKEASGFGPNLHCFCGRGGALPVESSSADALDALPSGVGSGVGSGAVGSGVGAFFYRLQRACLPVAKKKRTAPFLPAHCMDFKLFSEIVQKKSTKSSPWLDLRAVKFGGPGRGGGWRRCFPLPCTPASRPGRACSRTGTSKMFREIPTHVH